MPTTNELSPAERRARARAAAFTSWGNTPDRSARTARGRAAFEQRFLDQANGDPVRAESMRKAYFASLTRKSLAARRAKPSPLSRAGGAA
ncbi:hypothetical protein [Isoptericola sp. NPDC057653]|uniref:hypothetical protein n=1 Tax=Isoptericola sp. NPDC057653 TaxID=3346195 RepID=UPI0036A66FDA